MVLFHADDYGINKKQSERILSCYKRGVLQSVSILANSPAVEECAAMLPDGISKAIHINFAEGMCLSDPAEIPLLAGKNGKFRQTFLKLLILSVFRKKELKEQVKTEAGAQIRKVLMLLPQEYKLRIDSHRHYHMIPAVFDGICAACMQSGREVEYLRIPNEQMRIYIHTPRLLKYIKPVNLIKICVLKACLLWDRPIARKYGLDKKSGSFAGLMFTTQMKMQYVLPMLSCLKKYGYFEKGRNKRTNIEILFHPGGIKPGEGYLDYGNKPMEKFYSGKGRWMEADTLKELRKYGY